MYHYRFRFFIIFCIFINSNLNATIVPPKKKELVIGLNSFAIGPY